MEYTIKDFTSLEEHLTNEDNIIYVKSHNCGVCDVMYPLIKEICNTYGVDLLTIQIEDFKEFRGKYSVFTVPTVLVFYYGKEMIRESRFINQNNIKHYFNKKRELTNN